MSDSGQKVYFGLCTDQNLSFDTLAERWQYFEELGLDSVWDCDHFNQTSQPTGPYFEGWTMLAALAVCTKRIRIGVLVSCNTFRHPGLLAQEAVTVDHISHGRLELGMGCGYTEGEHSRFGIELPPPVIGAVCSTRRCRSSTACSATRPPLSTGVTISSTAPTCVPLQCKSGTTFHHRRSPDPDAAYLRRVRQRLELLGLDRGNARARPDPRPALPRPRS